MLGFLYIPLMSQLPIYQVSIRPLVPDISTLPEVMPQAQAVGIPASAMTTSGKLRGGKDFGKALGKGPMIFR